MPVLPQYADIDIPAVGVFSFLFQRKEKRFPDDKVIYQDSISPSTRQYSYATVRDEAITFGKGLKSIHGIRKGDVVAVFSPNDVDTPIITFGALWAGATISPANPGYTTSELAYQLSDSGAKVVVAHLDALSTVRAACKEVGIDEDCIIILGAKRDESGKFPHWREVRNQEGTARYRSPKIDPKNDVAFLVYSSGTTGRPKGVMITHHNMVANVLQTSIGESSEMTSTGTKHIKGIPDGPQTGDKILSCLPFYHIYGLNALIHGPLYNGIATVVLARFEIETWCRIVQDHGITFVYIVPPMALLLAKHPNVPNYNLSSIRMTNSGAAPLTKELTVAVFERTGVRIKQGYGLSETSPTAFTQRWEDWQVGMGSVGWLQPNMEAKFCEVGAEGDDKTGQAKEVATGEVGELYLKGPNIFKGYWKNEAATKECLSSDGWFRTGDVGFINSRGDFYITDRVKELIKYKGFQVPPAELEGYLVDHELVDDVAVVGIESVELGTEVPQAFVVRKGGLKAVQHGDDRKIIDWLAGKVANHKKLRGGVKFVDAVPKSPSGKILRRLLRDQARKEAADEEKRKGRAKL